VTGLELANALEESPSNLGYIRRLAAEVNRLERMSAALRPEGSEALKPAAAAAHDQGHAAIPRTEAAAV